MGATLCQSDRMTEVRRLLTAAHVARLLDKSVRTIQRMAEDGRLPYVSKIEGDTGAYVFDADVIEHLARQERETA